MLADDEFLDRIERRAAAIGRRRRALVGAAAVLTVLVMAGGLALAGGDRPSAQVRTDGDPAPETTTDEPGPTASTTSTMAAGEAPTTTAPASTTTSTGPAGSSTVPGTSPAAGDTTTSTTPATAPPETAVAIPPATISETGVVDGLTVDVTLTYPGAPGQRAATATIRLRTDRGSGAGGSIGFDSVDRGSGRQFGADVDPDCVDTSSSVPDPDAGPVDQTWTITYEYRSGPGRRIVPVFGYTSLCTADQAIVEIELEIVLP